MKARAIWAASATVFFAHLATAQAPEMVMDAESLLRICTTAHPDTVGFCNGFMQAAHDFPALETSVPITCPPAGTTRTQMAELYSFQAPLVFTVMPSLRSEPAILVARGIMAHEYPCPG